MKQTSPAPLASRPLRGHELPPERKILQRVATNAVREACEVRRGRLTPRAILAYQWLADPSNASRQWSLAWLCLEMDWNVDDWRKKALAYVHKQWRRVAWRGFLADLDVRSRQVRALAEGTASDYLPLVELLYWREIAGVDLPDVEREPSGVQESLRLELGTLGPTTETGAK